MPIFKDLKKKKRYLKTIQARIDYLTDKLGQQQCSEGSSHYLKRELGSLKWASQLGKEEIKSLEDQAIERAVKEKEKALEFKNLGLLDTFKYEGTSLKVSTGVSPSQCVGCFFDNVEGCTVDGRSRVPHCCGTLREDGEEYIFVEVEGEIS